MKMGATDVQTPVAPALKSPPPTETPAPSSDQPQQQKLDVVEKVAESSSEENPAEAKPSEGSVDRDSQLERVETEKKMSLINAWEENEKCKAETKAHKKIANVQSWEKSKVASLEAELRKIEEKLEKKKAERGEEMNKRIANVHKEAEEKKATIEAKRGEYVHRVEETAEKYRATGKPPKKILGLF